MKRIKEVIAHYANQTEDEEAAEIEVALKAENIALMDIPTELVPKVRALLTRKRSAGSRPKKSAGKINQCTGLLIHPKSAALPWRFLRH